MSDRYDAVIIGAGPAGLAAGIVLARHGLRVLIADRARLPIDKVCGEGILPPGVARLRQLGVHDHLDPAQTRPFAGIAMRSTLGTVASAPFAEGPGLGIRRLNLSRALQRAVQRFDGIDLREGVLVRDLQATRDGTDIQLDGRRVHARLLIGADGLNSRVRRWAGLDAGRQRLERLGARQHFRVPAWNDHVEVHYGHGIEAYVTPCADELVGVAFLWHRGCRPCIPGGAAMVPALLSAFPPLARRLRDAPTASTMHGVGPMHRVARAPCADGVILLGDAAGFLDACTGEGTSLALAEALSLEQTVVPILRAGREKPTRDAFAPFARAWADITRPYYQTTRLLLTLARHPHCFDRLVSAFKTHPDLMQHFLSAQTGHAPLWPGWSGAARLVRAFLLGH